MPTVVYSKPKCVQCTAVKRWLDKNDFAYDVVDVTQDQEAYQALVDAGFTGVPVTKIEGLDPFHGFDIKILEEAKKNGLL